MVQVRAHTDDEVSVERSEECYGREKEHANGPDDETTLCDV